MAFEGKTVQVAIIGAGPAGLFAAKELAGNGIGVVLFNRDIKPGGLAEYGIYPDKLHMKDGLRCQFRGIVNSPGIYYFGNAPIGIHHPINLEDILHMGFSAVLIAAGAQGTKHLGLPGEESLGVYHAKEVVYHYNHLPPFGERKFRIGKRIIVVGLGNVMTDIVRYLLTLPQVEEITTVARRGLAEIKFDKREVEPIVSHLDWSDFQTEVERITPVMKNIHQVPQEHAANITDVYQTAAQKHLLPPWRLKFLYSPVKILSSKEGAVTGVQVEENVLELTLDGVKAKGTGITHDLPAETIIFAIGDKVDNDLVLPAKGYGYALNPQPRFPMGGNSYELDSTAAGINLDNVFVCGWSRNASTGIVGIARKDALNAARVVKQYLSSLPQIQEVSLDSIVNQFSKAGYTLVTTEDVARLEEVEKQKAQAANLPEFRFDSNEEMLKVINPG